MGKRKRSFRSRRPPALSCRPASLDDQLCKAHAEAAVHAYFADTSTKDLQLHEVSNAQHTDPQLSRVADYVRCGFPDSLEEVYDLAKPFCPTRHQLYLANPLPGHSLLLMNGRTVISPFLQKKIILTLQLKDIKALTKLAAVPVISSFGLVLIGKSRT